MGALGVVKSGTLPYHRIRNSKNWSHSSRSCLEAVIGTSEATTLLVLDLNLNWDNKYTIKYLPFTCIRFFCTRPLLSPTLLLFWTLAGLLLDPPSQYSVDPRSLYSRIWKTWASQKFLFNCVSRLAQTTLREVLIVSIENCMLAPPQVFYIAAAKSSGGVAIFPTDSASSTRDLLEFCSNRRFQAHKTSEGASLNRITSFLHGLIIFHQVFSCKHSYHFLPFQ